MIADYEKTFPRLIDTDDADWSQFIDKLDEIDQYIREKIEGLDTLLEYERCPVEYLSLLGQIVYAGIENWDSETVKRKKIRDAIMKHKFSSTWEYDIKPAIENITGITPSLYNFRNMAFWVWDADRDLTNNLGWNISRWSAAREFPNSKIWNQDRGRVKGIVYIDVNTTTLTADDWLKIRTEVEKSAPVYMEIHVGYTDGGIWYDEEVINPV